MYISIHNNDNVGHKKGEGVPRTSKYAYDYDHVLHVQVRILLIYLTCTHVRTCTFKVWDFFF